MESAMPSYNKELSSQIKQHAQSLGFDLVGITSAKAHEHSPFFQSWLEKGYHRQMAYLEKGAEKRRDPTLVLPGAQSIICCGLNYYTQPNSRTSYSPLPLWERLDEGKGCGQISNYAWGRDYHKTLMEKLKILENFIQATAPGTETKSYVDTGPILERSYAQRAGLGWIGKNTCLIHPKMGSWFFLGEIITDLELEYDEPFETDHCGTCTRCLDACPTNALVEPRVLDARVCISYLTIEHRGVIPIDQRSAMGNHISGCDICQEVCPYNHNPIPTREKDFFPRNEFDGRPGQISLEKLAALTPEEFDKMFFESPVKRLKYEGLLRNTLIAMGNSRNTTFLPILRTLKTSLENPFFQEHIDWAMEKLNQTGYDTLF